MKAWFNKQSREIQLILLLIPIVNWIIELGVRWSNFLEKKDDSVTLIVAIVATVGGLPLGFVDFIWCLLYKHMILAA